MAAAVPSPEIRDFDALALHAALDERRASRGLSWQAVAEAVWDLEALHTGIATAREARDLTWAQTAAPLRCTPSQLTGLSRAKFATGMGVAMRVTQWLERPAAEFIYAARW